MEDFTHDEKKLFIESLDKLLKEVIKEGNWIALTDEIEGTIEYWQQTYVFKIDKNNK